MDTRAILSHPAGSNRAVVVLRRVVGWTVMAQGPLDPGCRVSSPTLDVPPRFRGLRGTLGVHPGVLLVLAAAALVPSFASGYWVFYVCVGMVLAIACLGLQVVVGWTRELSLAQAGLTGGALYVSSDVCLDSVTGERRPFLIGAAVGIVFVVAISVLMALVSYRLVAAYVVVVTLSLQFVLENTLLRAPPLITGLSAPVIPRPDFFGVSMRSDKAFYYYVLAALLATIGILHRLRISRFGRSLILVGSDPEAAAVSGVSPWRYRLCAFVIAGLCAGIAGALSGPLYRSSPGPWEYLSWNSMFYLSIPVLAGFGSLTAVACVAIGCSLLPLAQEQFNAYVIGGAGLLIGVLLGPRGLTGAVADLFARSRPRPPLDADPPSEPLFLGTVGPS